MAQPPKNAISPRRSEDYPEWFQQVVKAADLAELSPVRGCMVIKPWGYAIWENIQKVLDGMFKETGHVNAYFPIFIPKSFLEQEAKHVEGFAKECAVVTHHRLEAGPDGTLVPAGELDEPLIVRPTSETIIGHMYAKWVQSYRDLPILINQWANVVRWEMRTRMFLRTTEFLWQEGHTAHATAAEAMEETRKMVDVYERFAREYLAIPVIKGEKTKEERFPGADQTYTIEAMMQDGKALQAGTSHFLGQNFAKASGIKFLDQEGKEQHAWTTSWGVSTRLIGGLVMTHSDDDGLIVPPRMAPKHVVIMPIYRSDEERVRIMEFCDKLAKDLTEVRYGDDRYGDNRLRVEIDRRDMRGGEKVWANIKRGVPVRIEVGPRDLDAGTVVFARRDLAGGGKRQVPVGELAALVPAQLAEMQQALYDQALARQKAATKEIDNLADFRRFFTPKNAEKPETHGGFAICHWVNCAESQRILDELKVTPRCVPMDLAQTPGRCVFTGAPTSERLIFAKSY